MCVIQLFQTFLWRLDLSLDLDFLNLKIHRKHPTLGLVAASGGCKSVILRYGIMYSCVCIYVSMGTCVSVLESVSESMLDSVYVLVSVWVCAIQ